MFAYLSLSSLSFPFLFHMFNLYIIHRLIAFLCGLRIPTIQFSITFQCVLREIIMFSVYFYGDFSLFHHEKVYRSSAVVKRSVWMKVVRVAEKPVVDFLSAEFHSN